jgi:hypothetical protein
VGAQRRAAATAADDRARTDDATAAATAGALTAKAVEAFWCY